MSGLALASTTVITRMGNRVGARVKHTGFPPAMWDAVDDAATLVTTFVAGRRSIRQTGVNNLNETVERVEDMAPDQLGAATVALLFLLQSVMSVAIEDTGLTLEQFWASWATELQKAKEGQL